MVPHEDCWAIKEEGVSTFKHKDEAVGEAKKLVKRKQISAIIHDRNGCIQSAQKPSNRA
ncbi:DUF2188 domain-containing protein [Paenibacillus sp. BJ-4]|uniref:DUF2188 domain-containing protein n=1 Tax=Paenibacillus sp. BJ-4 TaxID=2878097 RepID=UPI001CF0C822|nr:DUF2188 domain-containing protein [Paenibacillus sp. BJ-4]